MDRGVFQKLSLLPFFAWVGLGADGLSSSSYGPEGAFLALGDHAVLAIFVAIMMAVTVFVISAGYSQVIELFPTGGGGYLVASKLLGPNWGMISGCALLIDYVLTVAISISASADAIFSFLPHQYDEYRMTFVVGGILLLTVLNLRGVRETVVPMVPIFLIFVATHAFAIVWSLVTHASDFGQLSTEIHRESSLTLDELGFWGMVFLLLRAFSVGAGTFTGIEAVSNGVMVLREPRVSNGKRTMRYMAWSLAITAVGLTLSFMLWGVESQPGKTLNAVLFESVSASWGEWPSRAFVWTTLLSAALILFIAAQAGFIGGPKVLSNMSQDRWFPSRFGLLSDRLVTQNGVLLLAIGALITVILTVGSVKLLVVLYSINVFLTFTLTMAGLIKHWWNVRERDPHWRRRMAVPLAGFIITASVLVSITAFKFDKGGWVTILVTGGLVLVAMIIRRHYYRTKTLLRRLDKLVRAASVSRSETDPSEEPVADPRGRTAVLLVNGFNGLGLHTLFSVQRLFGDIHRNFVFVHVGVVDSGNFKGIDEMEALRRHVDQETSRYVSFMRNHGVHAEGFTSIGTDVVDEALEIAPRVLEKYPQSVFYGGQLVFPEDSWWTRLLHNNIVFALQRRFYNRGIPFVILPIRVY